MDSWFASIAQMDKSFVYVFQGILRYFIPALAVFILIRTVRPLLTFRKEPETWGWLCLKNGKMLPLTHWENVIGRSRRSDVIINTPYVSRSHAVLTRYDDGSWSVADMGSKTGVFVNGKRVEFSALEEGDMISVGRIRMRLQLPSREQEITLTQLRSKATRPAVSVMNTLLLTALQLLICFSYLMTAKEEVAGNILAGFMGIIVCQWLLLGFYLFIRKPSFELESIVFFLCTMGMAAIAAVKPTETVKQLISMVMGIGLFVLLGWILRDLERVKRLRYYAAAGGIFLLIITLLLGKEINGAKNWLILGPLSLQPSELSKVCFVFIGAATMDQITNKKNLILFICYTMAICACLTIMKDFGTALIFFVAFLLIAYLRSGSVGTVALACTALGYAGVMAVRIAPHAMQRFANWRHIWDDPFGKGYQQTQALIRIASGGLLGLGAGNGFPKKVFAGDSDMVFASLSEELGLLMALMVVVCIIVFGIFALRTAAMGRSSFYTIGACTAAGILLVQTAFNVLGTLDVLPLTGVTLPFVSNGGSSMICTWGLMAFIKAADTRQDASFAVRQGQEGRTEDE